MSHYQRLKQNAEAILLNKKSLSTMAMGAVLGSLTYWGPPTLAQKVFNKDLTGFPGAAIGLGTGIATAIALNRHEVIVGNVASLVTHLAYVYNDKTVDVVGAYNWRLGKGMELPIPGTMSDSDNMGHQVMLPDGQMATAYNPLSSVPALQTASLPAPTPLSNYIDNGGNKLNDYMDNSGNQLNDYMNNDGQSLNDYMDNSGNQLNDYMDNSGNQLNDYMNNDGQSLNDDISSELSEILGGF